MPNVSFHLTYGDLVKLLKDDQVSFHVGKSIVQTFTDKYLKGIANSEEMKRQGELTRAAVKQVLEEKFGAKFDSYYNKVTLSEECKKSIQSAVNLQIALIVEDEVRKHVVRIPMMVDKAVKDAIGKAQEDYIKSEVTRRINDVIKGLQ